MNSADNRPIVVSFSGGKSSAMMCDLLENHPDYKHRTKHYVFANTGKEMPATLSFVRWWGRYLSPDFDHRIITMIEAVVHHDERKSSTYKIVEDWQNASYDGQPFAEVVKKYGLPSISFPHCTRELKVNPIRAYIREHLGLQKGEYVQAIGMRFDEPRRIKQDSEFIYPLYDNRIVKQDVVDFFAHPDRENFTLGLEDFEGNCDFCFKKDWKKLEKMRDKHPTRILWWADLEDKYWEKGTSSFRGHRMAWDLLQYTHRDDKDIPCACGHNEDSSF